MTKKTEFIMPHQPSVVCQAHYDGTECIKVSLKTHVERKWYYTILNQAMDHEEENRQELLANAK